MNESRQTPVEDLVALLEDLPGRSVRATRHPSVFTSRLPFLPFLARRVERGRRRVVEVLRERFPHGLLRLADWDDEPWSDLGEEERRGDGQITIMLDPGVTTGHLLSRLYEGGWVLALFERADERDGAVLPHHVPTDVAGLFGVLRSIGAAVLISSWYDDLEWTVALRPFVPGRPDDDAP